MKRIEFIGILTIISGTIWIVTPNSLSGWIWGGLNALDPHTVYPIMRATGILLGVLGIAFGAATLMKRKWSWKANFALHLVLVPLVSATVVSDFSIATRFLDLRFFPTNTVLMFAIAVIVLLLLSRPDTRAVFRNTK